MDFSFAVRVVLRAWLMPPAVLLLLALIGVALAGRWPRFGRTLAALSILAVVGMAMPVVSVRLERLVEIAPPLDLDRPTGAGAIVVLAGGSRPGPAPGLPDEPREITLERMAKGAEVARATGLPALFSGGVVSRPTAEAVAMQDAYRRYFGLQARWLEVRSRTTSENARYSAEILRAAGVRRVVLVTSANHMRRSIRDFEAYGLDVVPAPVGVSVQTGRGFAAWLPQASVLRRSADAIYELVGYWAPAPRPLDAPRDAARSPAAASPSNPSAQAPASPVR
jgi:uncharacterized SAM-binding protein YcdF (DUF218 family)